MASNSENTAWNDLHNGSRVPINDTDLTGAPAALSSADPSWASGSLNKAVKSTWDANLGSVDVLDQVDYDAGVLDLKRLGKYIHASMLYGYKGDSVDSDPGDMMSYRAYPTPILTSEGIELQIPNSNIDWNLDGSVGSTSGTFCITKYVAAITFALGYDLYWEVFYTPPTGPAFGIMYEVRIEAGYKTLTHYRVSGDTVWIALPQNALFFSFNTSSSSGDIILQATPDNFAQTPYYGVVLAISSITVTEAEYAPVAPPAYILWTQSFKSPRIWLDCVVTTCSETSEDNIKHLPGNERDMYAPTGEVIGLGSRLYKNLAGLVWDEPATYCNAAWVYYSTPLGVNVYQISRIFTVDASGYITYYKLLSSPPGCYELEECL